MKTKFFKKLSFVLVVAMVLSLFVPAAGAFAAKAPKLNSTNKYLHLDVDKLEEFNFNINNKTKGWKYFWESANEDVAKVNEKNGVTVATGVGKTQVTVTITDADDEEVAVLSADVTVRDNIEEVTISNGPEDGKLAVGEEFDFNRSYVTRSGSSKKTSAITRWTVEPAETADIDDKGVFVATEAGEYTITARSFQSKAKYKDWQKDAEKYADYVLDFDTTTVVVGGSMLEAKQHDVQKVKVTFDSTMVEDDVKKNLSMSLVIGTVEQPQYIKSISLDEATKTEATVELHGPFNKGMTYKVNYPEMDSLTFIAASTNFTDVADITIDTGTAVAGEATEIKFSLYDANGVNITDGVDSEYNGRLKDRVTISTDSNGAHIVGNEITIFEVNTIAEVKAVYNTYIYDDQGKELGTRNAIRNIVGVKEATVPANSLAAFTVTIGTDDEGNPVGPDWDKLNKQIPIGAVSPKIYAMVKDTDGTEIKSDNPEFADNFTFELTDDNVLFVSPNGDLYPVKVGTSVVIVKYGDTIVGYADVVVVAEAKTSSLVLSDYNFTLSTDAEAEDSKEITLTVKDQYGNDMDVEGLSVTPLDLTNVAVGYITVNEQDADKKVVFTVGTFGEAGRVQYQLEANGFKRTVTVTLAPPTGKVTYRLSLNNIDLAIGEEADLDKTLDIQLIGYGTNGVKYTSNIASAASIKITNQDGLVNGQDLYEVDGVSGGAISKIKTGTYRVVATYPITDGSVVATGFFTVTDSQKPAVFTSLKNGYYTAGSTDKAVAAECFEIKIDGNEVAAENILKVTTGGGSVASGSVYVTEVDVKQYFGDDYIVHTVKIGKTVRVR